MKKINLQDHEKTTIKPELERRILARRVAREMSAYDLRLITGGTDTCSWGGGDDCPVLK